MSTDVSELLLRYEELREQGRPASAEDLCRDAPELLPELERRIDVLQAMDRVLTPYGGECTTVTERRADGVSGNLPDVPGYEILEEIGRGGMGVVFKARQKGLRRLVALKVILSGDCAGAEERARFRAEYESLARLNHPHIVHVYEAGEAAGRPFFSMELLTGGSLAQLLDGRPQPPRHAAHLVETLARAIHAAHLKGVIHRDLKPANVLFQKPSPPGPAARPDTKDKPEGEDGAAPLSPRADSFYACPAHSALRAFVPKIADFGIAKRTDSTDDPTASGRLLGTIPYMAPEQAAGRNKGIDARTDVHGLGVILYELLTGRPPFKGATPLDTLEQVCHQEPAAVTRWQPRCPRELETICLKCLRKDPAERYASARALADDLHAYLAGEPIAARPPRTWERAAGWVRRRPMPALLLAVASVALLGLGVGFAWYHPFAAGPAAVLGLLLGGGWFSARLRAALRETRERQLAAERNAERVHLVLEMTRRLVSTCDLDALLHLLAECATRLVDAEGLTVYLVDHERKELWSRVLLSDRLEQIRLPLGVGIAGQVALTGRAINSADASADPHFNPAIDRRCGGHTRNMLTLPMIGRNRHVFGVFQVLNKRSGPFTDEDVEILYLLEGSAAVALENAQRVLAT